MRRTTGLGYSVGECYAELYRVLCESLVTLTEDCRLDFAGSFARFMHVVQTRELPKSQVAAINAFRGRARKGSGAVAEVELARFFHKDLEAVRNFVAVCLGDAKAGDVASSECLHPEDVDAGKEVHTAADEEKNDGQKAIRVAVDSWDAYYIYCTCDNDEGETLKVSYNNETNFLGNWKYLAGLLRQGSQLNLVHPYEKDGIVFPEIIIYEPDYLMDVSSIAASYEPFGATPYNYLLRKIEPQTPSRHKLLGNFASQLLDEELNGVRPYSESAKDFFCHNALQLVACANDLDGFHADARAQQSNIREILHTAFTEDGIIDAEKILLEPSFFCETLGLQGRMDLMQSDYRVLMEQKSGKKEYRTNGHVEKHYCQMLLYLAVLHYAFNLRNDEISCYLLYSRYADGLIKETVAPHLLFELLRLRNQIVWNEFHCSRGGIRLLEVLTIDKINTKNLCDRFTQQYLLAPMEQRLRTVQTASPLEREYFFRMFTFVQREHVLAKIGSSQKEASGLSALWNCTLKEKRLAGNIFSGLIICQICRTDDGSDGIIAIELLVPDDDADYMPNFRKGDVVVLYSYRKDEVPDVRRGMVIRASIETMATDHIRLQLRAAQKNETVFRQDADTRWAVEHDFIESTNTALYRSLFSFLQAPADRRQLLLAQRQPVCDTSIALLGDYSLGGTTPEFNELVLKSRQARDYFILIGPPGTGKTSFGLVNIMKEELAAGGSVLLLSYTNRAVDEICSKLVKEGLDFIRIGSRLSCTEAYHPYLLEEKVTACPNAQAIGRMLMSARIVVGTTTTITSYSELLGMRSFSLAIVDEASQILEPHLLGILSATYEGGCSVERFVLIGDHKQLPAVVQQGSEESRVEAESLRAIGLTDCRNSLFERLLRLNGEGSPLVHRFTHQGRMHEEVADFASAFFYENRLGVIPLPHQTAPLAFDTGAADGMERLMATQRFAFIDVPRPQRSASAKVNQAEAEVIAKAVAATYNIYRRNGRTVDAAETIGVIVPYRNQIAVVRREIARLCPLTDITIDTVERYQGSERDVIIYGFTVQYPYQLDFLTNNVFEEDGRIIDRKLNVALTRAREQMLIVGNNTLLSQNETFRNLISRCYQG